MNKKISKTISRSIGVVCFGVFLNIYFIIPVHAYIDPATTAMLTQIVAGIFISIGVAFGIFRKRIFLFFKNIGIKRLQRKIEKQNRKNKAL